MEKFSKLDTVSRAFFESSFPLPYASVILVLVKSDKLSETGNEENFFYLFIFPSENETMAKIFCLAVVVKTSRGGLQRRDPADEETKNKIYATRCWTTKEL